MAKSACDGDISDWCDCNLVKQAFVRASRPAGKTTGGDIAALSNLRKFIDKKCYDDCQVDFGKPKFSKNGKMTVDTFISKEWFLTMSKGDETKAKAHAKRIADNELAAQDKDAKGPKKDTGVTGRLTDASKYTGAHKGRFDASGKGKGIDGREDRHANTGYTGQYKGEGTFKGDKK